MTKIALDPKERVLLLVEQIQVLSSIATSDMESKNIDVILGLISDISFQLDVKIRLDLKPTVE